MRAAHADREHVVTALKAAFVQGRLDRDELDARVGQAYAARTCAELAALTADIPADDAVAPARPATAPARPASTPARTLAKAARRSGVCMLIAVAMAEGGFLLVAGNEHFASVLIFLAIMMATAALGVLGYGFVDAWEERRARASLPPEPGQRHGGLGAGRPGGTGGDPALPGPTCAPTSRGAAAPGRVSRCRQDDQLIE
jgi:hypothetical protein